LDRLWNSQWRSAGKNAKWSFTPPRTDHGDGHRCSPRVVSCASFCTWAAAHRHSCPSLRRSSQRTRTRQISWACGRCSRLVCSGMSGLVSFSRSIASTDYRLRVLTFGFLFAEALIVNDFIRPLDPGPAALSLVLDSRQM
jgi:hypothetical protein